jgi:hypothetical protein
MLTTFSATARHLFPSHEHRVDPREQIIRRQRLVGRNGRLAVLADQEDLKAMPPAESGDRICRGRSLSSSASVGTIDRSEMTLAEEL